MSSLANAPSWPIEADSEDEIDWEEVEVPQPEGVPPEDEEHEEAEKPHLEITLSTRNTKVDRAKPKKKGISHVDRLLRIECHKVHTVCLLANAWVRNQWINDPLLHARLMSLTPLGLQNAFPVIHKSRVPDKDKRGRLFEVAIHNLTEWWSGTFEVIPTGHIRNRTFDEVQKLLSSGMNDDQDEDENEVIRSSKSLMKHALCGWGSRDVSAQLFTALCRALGIPARLVVSLQSVPWQAGVGKPKSGGGGGGKAKGRGNDIEKEGLSENDVEEVDVPRLSADVKGKGKAKGGTFVGDGYRLDGGSTTSTNGQNNVKGKERAKPVITLRKTKSKGHTLGSPSTPTPRRSATPDPTKTPPVFWTEVFSRPDTRWIPVDPIRCIVNKRKLFDPSPSSSYPAFSIRERQENRMVYVIALEEDSHARDVTPRYAREYGAKVAKVQLGGGGGRRTGITGKNKQQEWWKGVLDVVKRPYPLHRDDLEDEELASFQHAEDMPTTISGFKDHPLYILPRHMHANEVIYPLTSIGSFRGEPVYPRSSLVSLKTAENWMRSGRIVREGEQAMKIIKARAGTVGRMREINALKEAGEAQTDREGGGPEPMQGLYAWGQTELYQPPPVVDGKVPKNDFGNIDLYVPSMLPKGAVHVPFKGIAKIARKLGFDFAEAVTGFEFKKRRAFPIIEGVVVAAENESVLLEAYLEAEQDASEKARIKLHDRVIKRWTRLVQGLRIRHRLVEQYKGKEQQEPMDVHMEKGKAEQDDSDNAAVQPGGFLVGADDVVQAFELPKYQHVVPTAGFSSSTVSNSGVVSDRADDLVKPTNDSRAPIDGLALRANDDNLEDDVDMEEVVPPIHELQPIRNNGVPLTMRELAEVSARNGGQNGSHPVDEECLPASLPANMTSGRISANSRAPQLSGSRKNTPSSSTSETAPKSKRRPPAKRARELDEDTNSVSDANSSLKRGRQTAPSSAPTPMRTLRPRGSKSAVQIQEERRGEMAYRKAVAQ